MTDYTPTTDWRQIDTSTKEGKRALDIEIAKRLGWTVYAYCSDVKDYFILIATDWRSYTPEQRQHAIHLGGDFAKRTSEHEAWLDCQKYTNDLNAAVCLPLPGDRVFMEVRRWDDGLTEARVIDFPTWQTHYPEYHRDKQTAAAWCKAWLAWHDASTLGA